MKEKTAAQGEDESGREFKKYYNFNLFWNEMEK